MSLISDRTGIYDRCISPESWAKIIFELFHLFLHLLLALLILDVEEWVHDWSQKQIEKAKRAKNNQDTEVDWSNQGLLLVHQVVSRYCPWVHCQHLKYREEWSEDIIKCRYSKRQIRVRIYSIVLQRDAKLFWGAAVLAFWARVKACSVNRTDPICNFRPVGGVEWHLWDAALIVLLTWELV